MLIGVSSSASSSEFSLSSLDSPSISAWKREDSVDLIGIR
jgi:hypothetical protein